MRHDILSRREGEDLDHQFTKEWGRFPPHLRYNMDQVTLPFVDSQDSTYTVQQDTDVHIAGHEKATYANGNLPCTYMPMPVLLT